MATVITIERKDGGVTVHVTDATGRDETAHFPCYPLPGGEPYYRFVDALDVMMYQATEGH